MSTQPMSTPRGSLRPIFVFCSVSNFCWSPSAAPSSLDSLAWLRARCLAAMCASQTECRATWKESLPSKQSSMYLLAAALHPHADQKCWEDSQEGSLPASGAIPGSTSRFRKLRFGVLFISNLLASSAAHLSLLQHCLSLYTPCLMLHPALRHAPPPPL